MDSKHLLKTTFSVGMWLLLQRLLFCSLSYQMCCKDIFPELFTHTDMWFYSKRFTEKEVKMFPTHFWVWIKATFNQLIILRRRWDALKKCERDQLIGKNVSVDTSVGCITSIKIPRLHFSMYILYNLVRSQIILLYRLNSYQIDLMFISKAEIHNSCKI